MTDPAVENVATAALDLVADGMHIGLGTGHAALAFVSQLADRVRGGVDLDALAAKLQRDGADAFVASWQELLACLVDKSQTLKKAG